MTGIYREVDANGNVRFTNVPSGTANRTAVRPGEPSAEPQEGDEYNHRDTEKYIKEIRKRGHKLVDYLNYLEYLRHHNPYALDRALQKLREEDFQAWFKLQKHPQFRPLHQTALGLKAVDKHVAVGFGLATGKFGGSFEKWLETTVRDLMKRDRWGEHAQVLGSKATTLPSPKPPTYSNSKLGQYLKAEDARLVAAAKDAGKELELRRAGLRAAKGAAIVQPVGALVDFGVAALDPQTAEASAAILLRRRIDIAARNNPAMDLDTPAYEHARRLLSSGQYGELDRFLKQYE